MYKKATSEIFKINIECTFVFAISRLAGVCLRLEREQSKDLGLYIYDVVKGFSYGKNLPYDADAQVQGLIWSAVALWSSEESRSICALREAATEYTKSVHPGMRSRSAISLEITRACRELTKHCNVLAAIKFLTELLEALPKEQRQWITDEVVKHLCDSYGGTDEPLERFGIWQKRLDNTALALVKHLLPLTSPSGAQLAHFALAVSGWGEDPQVVRREIDYAASLLEQSQGKYVFEHVWVAYVAAFGLDGCLRAVRALASKPELLQRNAPYLLMCVLDQVPQKMVFLRELWASINSLKEYM